MNNLYRDASSARSLTKRYLYIYMYILDTVRLAILRTAILPAVDALTIFLFVSYDELVISMGKLLDADEISVQL